MDTPAKPAIQLGALPKDIFLVARDNNEFLQSSPYVDFEYVTVTFGTSANADTDIKHTLTPTSPESIDYQVVHKDRAVDVYNDRSGTRKAWGTGYIILRATVASAVVTLLLTVRRT